jgi:3-dehydroquinate dehydratase-2
MKILVLNGPNLNLLGRREPEVYGTMTLDALNRHVAGYAEDLNQSRPEKGRVELQFFQSNHEGQLIDTIQNAPRGYDGVIYNPAAHTHYSIALRDAIAAVTTPVVEVHLTDISNRESFRRASVIADVCIGQFMGKGATSYCEALDLLVNHIEAGQEG